VLWPFTLPIEMPNLLSISPENEAKRGCFIL
jgi:hypothetical protein